VHAGLAALMAAVDSVVSVAAPELQPSTPAVANALTMVMSFVIDSRCLMVSLPSSAGAPM
jgi:hypothetical protein